MLNMPNVRSTKSVASISTIWAEVTIVASLFLASAMAQEFAWPPSTPEGEPSIDYTRKVLSCSGSGCKLTVVRSQEQLLQALFDAPTPPIEPGPATGSKIHPVASTSNLQQQDEVLGQRSESAQQIHLSYGLPLILGGCFGGELPLRLVNESAVVTIPPEAVERMKAVVARLLERQQLLNSRSNPKAAEPSAQPRNVR